MAARKGGHADLHGVQKPGADCRDGHQKSECAVFFCAQHLALPEPALSESRTGPMEEPASAMAEPEAPAEGPRVVQAESAFATSANRETRAGEGSSSPAEQLRSSSRAGSPTLSSEGFPEQATPLPMEDTPSLVIQPSKEPVPTPSTSKKSEAEVKDSLQSRVRPPSSLLAIPQTAASPEASPRLTKQEVINIANAKARTHGYNRTDYRRAEPQYNAAYKVWSVSYEQRTADGMEEAGEHFSVIVDDKTKGTVFMLRR